MKTKTLLLIYTFLLLCVLPSHAVLKERNLANTLANLRNELTEYHDELERQSGAVIDQQNRVRKEMINVLDNSQQNALMLYSQKTGYIFDMTYACHQATEQYRKFHKNSEPFRKYINNVNVEVSRYDSLINDLSTMYVGDLSEKSKIDRNVCLTLAINIRRTLSDNRTQMKQYVQAYANTEKRLKALNDYANLRYEGIQQSIFTNGGSTYFEILADLHHYLRDAVNTINEKYKPKSKVFSDWDGRVVFGLFVVLFIVVVIALALSYLIVGMLFTWLLKHDKLDFIFEWFMKIKEGRSPKVAFKAKRPCIIMAVAVFLMALILGFVTLIWNQNFILMACGLLVEFIWLLGVILLSLLIRLNGDQIMSGFRIYSPLMLVGFIVISFRIILIPNNLVNLLFPPILLVCALWQLNVIHRRQRFLPKSDVFYSTFSLIVFAVSVIASWAGYTLFAVQLLIWWIMQLTWILTITCLSSMLKSYGMSEKRDYFNSETSIAKTWFFRLLYYVILPVMGTLSIIISIYLAADVFNLSDTIWRVFNMNLIDTKNFTLSIYNVVTVICLFFVFSYINHTTIAVLTHQFWIREQELEKSQEGKYRADRKNVEKKTSMWKNVIQVFVWGAWLLITMAMFNINNSWLVAISAGLSTGIGFAMKDILENIYYGISLMAGRIKVGDYISIDGTRGTVQSISYVSTTLETLDGSIMAFQNSQLFTKNYKNLTKNHGNELAIIPVGVAYGTNASQVKEVIAEAVKKIERRNYIKYLQTVFVGFGDNSIDFKILAWVDSRKQIYAESDILEAVYNALNANSIEIPYPQRDLHIVSDSTKKIVHVDSLNEAYEALKKSPEKNENP
jgi:small-conductance mechanosensitive channel